MNVEKYHQIANPEILYFLNLKKNWIVNTESKLVLKGILIAQEMELSFLNKISKWHEEFSVAYIKMVDERREALKISCEDLRKVLK